MSKLIVYILDRIVWLLLFTVITAQSLQIVGLMDPPKALEQITYPEENQYDYQLAVVNNEARGKRQTDATEQRSQLIDSLFNKNIDQGIYIFRLDMTKVIRAKI
ncbi:uncharacterized protein LOC123309079 isoform X2 [Coccinella septempunctata]|uniref:uncharacterized protein LOC123309079 isoform X2 n=1 Tax=Coccinella septempunctata TaxID=41139 RepID=UPI001D0955E2|nr:uncharacterized protein LOC123309079 isoform X2 [Coccinella septempunctata]